MGRTAVNEDYEKFRGVHILPPSESLDLSLMFVVGIHGEDLVICTPAVLKMESTLVMMTKVMPPFSWCPVTINYRHL
jgi:hypothetical protein